MADTSISLSVFINADDNRIYLYESPEHNDSNAVANYTSKSIGDEFFDQFCKLLIAYKQKRPQVSLDKVSLILPDNFFLTDMLTIPSLGKKAAENSLDLVIGTIYKNKKDLTYNTFPLSQSKQTMVYGMVGARKAFLDNIQSVCQKNNIGIKNITFAANAMANGAMAINPKLRTATCLLLDISEHYARFAFVNKGRTLGAYSLPFGYSILHESHLAAEDQLFDYASAELLVLNAQEKARAKRLTVMEEDNSDAANAAELGVSAPTEDSETEEEVVSNIGGRKLPKFMLRETPTDARGFVYENFRIFLKWTLDLIASNTKITSLGKTDTVYVNMPKKYAFLFDMVNNEAKENGVVFAPMFTDNTTSKSLETYGGFFVKQYNKLNNF